MHKKLIIVSQRAQAVDVTARGNVTWFYKCECVQFWFLPKFFRVYRTEEVDNTNNYPIWERQNSQGETVWKAAIYHSGFARKEVYDAYDSWYMRKNMKKSQEVHMSGYELNTGEKIKLLKGFIFKNKKLVIPEYGSVEPKIRFWERRNIFVKVFDICTMPLYEWYKNIAPRREIKLQVMSLTKRKRAVKLNVI